MSTTANPSSIEEVAQHYAERARNGDPEWLEDAIEDYLGVTVTDAQRRICRAIVENEKVLVQTANGLGKSFILACIANVWMACLYPANVLATSGTYPKLKRTFCKPIEDLHDSAFQGAGLPGTYKQSPPRIELDGEPMHFFEAASPKDAGELEGIHEGYVLGIIEEADKDDVDAETIDSMDSLVTDQRDRTVAIANPPTDESNSINELYDDSTWTVVRLSSFESHNVQVELGEVDGEKIDGLATLWKIKQDWESFNDEPWPGVEEARTAHEERTDLDTRWYRRRAGVMPPDDAEKWRPWSISDVEHAYQRDVGPTQITPEYLGIDVARGGGDKTVMTGLHGPEARVHYQEPGTDHHEQRLELQPDLKEWPYEGLNIDAVGEGSGMADELNARLPNIHRFSNGDVAADDANYRWKWDEGLHLIGDWLRDGGTFDNSDLYEELKVAARVLKFSVNSLASRGDVIEATPKADLKEELGHSPDYLDSLLMCLYAREHGGSGGKADSATFTW